jgi:predicted permease
LYDVKVQFLCEIYQDSRHTLRLWANRPWHTGFAIAALAIGIGATTGVFSVVNALLLRSLPFRDPGSLVSLPSLRTPLPPHDSSQQFHEWRRESTYLSDVALYEQADVNLGAVRGAMRAHVAQVSWNFFSMLGVRPVLGRAFGPEEDIPGHNELAVIGYGLWQQLFAGDRKALGATIRVDGFPLIIVGVAPAEFDFPRGAVLWKTAAFSPGNNGWETVARLKPGFTWQQARLAFNAELDRLSPNQAKIGDRNPPATITSLQDELAGSVKNASLMLMAGVVMILLIACTNVANLLMARTADRAAEFSIRSALGASRARLARQLLTECLLLSTVAGIAGLIIAFWSTAIAAKVHPVPLEAQSYSILDGRVLGFAMLASIVCALLFGVLPALYAGRGEGAGNWSSSRYSRVNRDTFVAVQVALTIVLLTASVSLGRAFVRMTRIDRGFDSKGVVTVSVSLEGTTYQDGKRRLAYFEEALARIRRLPGVRSASATEFLPLYATGFVGGPLGLDGRPAKLNPM